MPDIFVANNSKPLEDTSPKEQADSKVDSDITSIKDSPIREKPKQDSYASKLSTEANGNSGSVHLFTSFCQDPDDITFENQEEDEKVLLFIRKDLITNLPWIAIGLVLIIAPLIIISIANFFRISLFFLPSSYSLVISVSYYLLISIFLYINFITWYFNINLVTEKRIVEVDFQGIVYKEVSATKLTLVQDVSYTQSGVIRTIFNYGDVLVQTAGTIDNFTFDAVPRPDDAVHIVEDLIGKRNV
jgi:membrane protein YdbS with pleckstrin-like domain